MKHNSYIIGVDIGGTNTVLGLIDHIGTCRERTVFATAGFSTSEEYIDRLAIAITELLRSIPQNGFLAGIGIGAPAARGNSGVIQSPANLSWGTFNIIELLKKQLNYPIAVTNDSNAAALGEMKYGLAKGKKNFIVVTLGTGLGAGIVIEGTIVNGENDVAGELGHIILEPNGRWCGCGRQGCVETYVSASGLRRTVSELMANNTHESDCRNVNFAELTSEMIYQFAVKGDPIARIAFDVTGDFLGRMLANAASALDPEMIILSGGLMNAGELILRPTIESFNRNVLFFHKGNIPILQSQFSENEGAILGASCLISETDHNGKNYPGFKKSSEVAMNY